MADFEITLFSALIHYFSMTFFLRTAPRCLFRKFRCQYLAVSAPVYNGSHGSYCGGHFPRIYKERDDACATCSPRNLGSLMNHPFGSDLPVPPPPPSLGLSVAGDLRTAGAGAPVQSGAPRRCTVTAIGGSLRQSLSCPRPVWPAGCTAPGSPAALFPPQPRLAVMAMATRKPTTYHSHATALGLDDLVTALQQGRLGTMSRSSILAYAGRGGPQTDIASVSIGSTATTRFWKAKAQAI